MKATFTISKKKLLNSLQAAQASATKKSIIDDANSMVLHIENNEIQIKAGDGEVFFQEWLPIDIYSQESSDIYSVLNSKRFFDLTKDLDENITISIDESNTLIQSKNLKAQIRSRTLDQSIENPNGIENVLSIKKEDLINALDITSSMISSTALNSSFNSILIEIFDRSISFTSTDGHCLAHVKVAIETQENISENHQRRILMTRRAASETKKIIESRDLEKVIFGFADSQTSIVFSGDTFNFFTKTSSEKFPEYQQLLKTDSYTGNISCKKDALVSVLRRANIIINNQFIPSILSIKNSLMNVYVENKEVGNISEDIEIDNSGVQDISIKIYPPYLLQGIIKSKKQDVKIFMNNEKKPIIIHESIDKNEFYYLVMPIIKQ